MAKPETDAVAAMGFGPPERRTTDESTVRALCAALARL
jgi:hypothetical protein